MTRSFNGVLRITLLLSATALTSCSSPSREAAVPTELADRATVLNNSAIRTWDDTMNQAFMDELFGAAKHEFELPHQAGESGPLPPAH